ncbi:unnamed protein product [Cylicocyclus nassatus]|uniref:Uncharacterized protein n=1 Tax=Cylicocyclus nassatus TaxID=53992 RepID=A0AA36MER6_CYLNA|nr:unnamed protein product [Cylicocyclus nassatus]
MGHITKLVTGEDGEVREAGGNLSSGKQIRRPVNLLVPLELEDRTAKPMMSLETLDEEVTCIAVITGSRSETEMREHTKLTKEAISRQVSTALSIEEDYEHLKKERVF